MHNSSLKIRILYQNYDVKNMYVCTIKVVLKVITTTSEISRSIDFLLNISRLKTKKLRFSNSKVVQDSESIKADFAVLINRQSITSSRISWIFVIYICMLITYLVLVKNITWKYCLL